MFWSEIAKRFGPLSSEVKGMVCALCTLVSNKFHHVKFLKEFFVMIIIRRTGTFGLGGGGGGQ